MDNRPKTMRDAKRGADSMKTSNNEFFRWIQPVPAPVKPKNLFP
jgi:hypothetical protein